jgi:hypothetical protein
MYKSLTWFTALDLPAACWSLARVIIITTVVDARYRKVASSNKSQLEANAGFSRLLMYCGLLTKS